VSRNVGQTGAGAGEFEEARATLFEVVVGVNLDDATLGAAQRDGLAGEAEFFGETQCLRATGGKKFGSLDHVATV